MARHLAAEFPLYGGWAGAMAGLGTASVSIRMFLGLFMFAALALMAILLIGLATWSLNVMAVVMFTLMS